MDDSKVFKNNDSRIGDTSRFEAGEALKQSMAHGLSKLINYDEETQQFVEEFENEPENLGTGGN